MAKTKLAIVDMDGTLFDTDAVNYHAYKAALEKYGYSLSREEYLTFSGKNWKQFLPGHTQTDDATLLSRIHDEKMNLYDACLSYASENRSLFDLLELMRPQYHLAIGTTASRKNTFDILNHFGRAQFFDLILTGDCVKNHKPHPEVFLKCMEHFNTAPQDTVIFEDSETGVKAAQASGAHVYRYLNWLAD